MYVSIIYVMNNDSTFHIAGIGIPLKLVDAANKNELVIFAGAGVSSPGIPVFEKVVEEALEKVKHKHDKIASLPERLDRVQRDRTKVKQLVANVISEYQKKSRSQNHQTLLNFFKNKDKIRIVTTNYDSNFYEAAQALKLEGLQQYCQPNLPFGDEFKGIVYLHGRIDDTDSMIMTQTDFSEAYLNRQRTRLFLQELFNQYTVLFQSFRIK